MPAPSAPSPLRLSLRLDRRASEYVLGRGVLSALPGLIGADAGAVLIDHAVPHGHRSRLLPVLRDAGRRPLPTRTLVGGEESKSLETLDFVYRWLAEIQLPRDGTLVGVGGGALLDLAGFAAATWHRGVRFVAVPTTLLAMVDAALGGKTAIDVAGVKNNVGAFHPAAHILADPDFLATLPRREWRCGLAEMVKAAVIGSRPLFASLERRRAELARCFAAPADGDAAGRSDPAPAEALALPWPEWIGRAARVKARIVQRDFRESGPRRALNLGHTLGHVLEATMPLSHGEAVAVGMSAAAAVAARRGLCPPRDAARLTALLAACGLPTSAPLPARAELERLLAGDKKRLGGSVHWVLPERIGRVAIDQAVEARELLAAG